MGTIVLKHFFKLTEFTYVFLLKVAGALGIKMVLVAGWGSVIFCNM